MSNAVNHPVASVRIQPQAFDVGVELRALRQTEDGIRDSSVTGVQTCALPISRPIARIVTQSR